MKNILLGGVRANKGELMWRLSFRDSESRRERMH